MTGCWLWTGYRNPDGYGQMRIDRRLRTVSRAAAAVYLGFDLDSQLHVLHDCDNPPCFNPRHLFIGTNADNRADSHRKGRHARAKLTEARVVEIIRLLQAREPQRTIAARYGISQRMVSLIATRRKWRHVLPDEVIPSGPRTGEDNGHAKLTEAQARAIKRRAQSGEELAAIAADFEVAPSTVSAIKRGERWHHLTATS